MSEGEKKKEEDQSVSLPVADPQKRGDTEPRTFLPGLGELGSLPPDRAAVEKALQREMKIRPREILFIVLVLIAVVAVLSFLGL